MGEEKERKKQNSFLKMDELCIVYIAFTNGVLFDRIIRDMILSKLVHGGAKYD